MSQSRHEVNTLTSMIESIEGRITALMEQEMREKIEQQRLLDGIKMLEEKTQNKTSMRQRMTEQHRANMKFMDEKIANHEDTFLKFKQMYESLKGNSINSSFFKYNPNHNQQKSSGFSKAEKRVTNLEESVITARSTLHEGDRFQWQRMNESMNVVSEMECETCGEIFKPYSYYQHLPLCKHQKIPAQMCTSMLVD